MKKNAQRVLACVCVLTMLITLLPGNAISVNAATKLKLNYSQIVMKKGTKLTLKASGVPAKKNVTWKSSKKKVAIVSSKGVVKAKAKGTTTITAKAGAGKATCKVTVGTPVTAVKVAEPTISVAVGATATISASVVPQKATIKTVSYKSADATIATVNEKGIVTGVKEGTTKITVKSKDGNKKKSTVTVTVTAAGTPAKVNLTTTENPDANPITEISLNHTEEYVAIGNTLQLTATIKPENPTYPTLTWASQDASVASVDANGLVQAKKRGDTVITATAKSGRVAKCVIHACEVYRVTDQKQLNSALETSSADIIQIVGSEAAQFSIPENDYSNVTLVVDNPKAEVINKGKFKRVTIKNVAPDTYHEYAKGNALDLQAPNSHIVVEKNATAYVYVKEGTGDTTIENNGTVKEMVISDAKSVVVTGTAVSTIPVSITKSFKLVTNQNMQISAITTFDITINPGAEQTTIQVDKFENKPQISGLGMITITVTETGQVMTVISSNIGTVMGQDVKFTGSVKDIEEKPVTGAAVYVVPYQENYDIAKIEQDPDVVKMVTDGEGRYEKNNIKTGNYILVIKEEAYMVVRQNLVITSMYGNNYNNEEINVLPKSFEGKKGTITGTISEAQEGKHLSGITVYARNNKNNLVDDAIAQTKTNKDGKYTFEDLAAGYYTIQVVDERENVERRYVSTYFNVLVYPDKTTTGLSATMSYPVEHSQMRFILTWGDEESGAISDADSHLIGPKADGIGKFHTYFSDKTYSYMGDTYADLDVDDIDYEGPETTTIYQEVDGVYRFYIHDYTNGGSEKCDRLSKSDVRVEVYSGSFLLATYHVPDQEGTLWHVCDYNSVTGKLTTVNEMGYENCSISEIGMTKQELREKYLAQDIESIQNSISLMDPDFAETYKQKIDQLSNDYVNAEDEDSAEKIYQDIQNMKNQIKQDIDVGLKVSGDCVTNYTELSESNQLFVYFDAGKEKSYDVTFQNAEKVEEITPPDSDAAKAYKVTLKNGVVRSIRVYEKINLIPTKVTVNGKEVQRFETHSYDDEEIGYLSVYTDEKNVSLENVKVYIGDVEGQMDADEETVTLQYGGATKKFYIALRYRAFPSFSDAGNNVLVSQWEADEYNHYIMIGEAEKLSQQFQVTVPEGFTCTETIERANEDGFEERSYTIEDSDGETYTYYLYYYSKKSYNQSYGIESVHAYNYEKDAQDDSDNSHRTYYGTIDYAEQTINFSGSEIAKPIRLELDGYELEGMDVNISYVDDGDCFAKVTIQSKKYPQIKTTYKAVYTAEVDEDDLQPRQIKLDGKGIYFHSNYEDTISIWGPDRTVQPDQLEAVASNGLKATFDQDEEGTIQMHFSYGEVSRTFQVKYMVQAYPEVTDQSNRIVDVQYLNEEIMKIYGEGKIDWDQLVFTAPDGYTCKEIPERSEEDSRTFMLTTDTDGESEESGNRSHNIRVFYVDLLGQTLISDAYYYDAEVGQVDAEISESERKITFHGTQSKAPEYFYLDLEDYSQWTNIISYVSDQAYFATVKLTNRYTGYEKEYQVYYENTEQ